MLLILVYLINHKGLSGISQGEVSKIIAGKSGIKFINLQSGNSSQSATTDMSTPAASINCVYTTTLPYNNRKEGEDRLYHDA